ncbi:MAG TPA: hypothetical protein VFZ99_07590 [Terriglobales bacterium]
MSPYQQERLGSLLGTGGVFWAVYIGTHNATQLNQILNNIVFTRGPLQLIGIGLIIWLHGKYRRAVHVNRA